MSTRCQVLVNKTNKHGGSRVGMCPKYGKKFFHIQTDGRWGSDRVVGICEHHLQTHSNPMNWSVRNWDVGNIKYLGGKVLSFEEVEAKTLKEHQTSIHHEAVKDRLKVLFSYKHYQKVSREDWQRLFQEALDEYCVKEVQDA